MIIDCDLMVQLGLTAEFKRQVLQWNGATVHMKEHICLIGKSGLNKSEMHEVVMQTIEPDSIREATERMVNFFDSSYAKSDLK